MLKNEEDPEFPTPEIVSDATAGLDDVNEDGESETEAAGARCWMGIAGLGTIDGVREAS